MSSESVFNFEKNDELIENIQAENKKNFLQILNSARNLESIYKKMVSGEISTNATDFMGKNVLFHCSTLRDFKRFIDLGVYINHRDNTGQNLAFKEQHIPYIKKLIQDNHLNIKDVYDKYGNNAFFKASDSYYEVLFEKGLDINHLNKNNESALFYSNARKTESLLKLGINTSFFSNDGMHPLFGANLNKTLVMLKYNADVNVINPLTGCNALFYITEIAVLSYLIDNGINRHHLNNRGENALFNANSFEVLRQMIDIYNLDFNLINKKGETVLFRKHEDKTDYLLEKGIDPYKKDKKGFTAMAYIPSCEALKIYLKRNIKIRDYVINKGINTIKDNFKIPDDIKEEVMKRYTNEEKEILLSHTLDEGSEKEGRRKRL